MNAAKVVRRNVTVFWRAWRFSFFLSVLSPVMFLSAMGLGLGSMVSETDAFGGVDYVDFFATGMLAATCMQAGVFNATYPIMMKMMWQRNYEAMLASPLEVRDIFLGELASIGLMLAQVAVPFAGVMALFGVFDSPMAILAIPVAVLLGLACASVIMAFTATLQTDEAYTWLFRFVVTPLFLLSGTFFPIDELPLWGKVVAQATPLYHGVELVRQLAIYELEASALWHLGYLLVMLGIGTALGMRNLERRLVP
ncbi:MAG: ABC transporter [Actinobacteria bacterium]|nr:ABC transporter [Actinomycetota bacterium]